MSRNESYAKISLTILRPAQRDAKLCYPDTRATSVSILTICAQVTILIISFNSKGDDRLSILPLWRFSHYARRHLVSNYIFHSYHVGTNHCWQTSENIEIPYSHLFPWHWRSSVSLLEIINQRYRRRAWYFRRKIELTSW